MTMQPEIEGAERERQDKAIEAQHQADLEHLLKNVHPSLRDTVTLGDASNGACQSVSDYSAPIFRQEIELLKETNLGLRDSVVCLSSELAQLKQIITESALRISQLSADFETLRLKLVHDATPETPADEAPALPQAQGAEVPVTPIVTP